MTDEEEPVLTAGEMAISMKACGLCGTDLEKISGDYTASTPVLGHEAVGVVKVANGAEGFKVGDRVFPHHHVPDNDCYLCKAGNETMCVRYRGTNLTPGGFSETFIVPDWNVKRGGVLKLPDEMGFELASLIEPLACCIRGIRKCKTAAGESVLIAGAGPVGMMHAMLLKEAGAKVLVSDVSLDRLEFADKAKVGMVLDANGNIPAIAASETDGRGVDLAIVASGSRGAIMQGLRSVRKGGKICLFGIPAKGSVLDYDIGDLYNSEQEVVTSYGAAERDTREALGVLTSRGAEFGKLITHRFPLERFDEALAAAGAGTAMKVVVTP